MLPWKQDKARSRRGGAWSQLLITANGPERAGKVHESSQARCHHAQHLRALAQTTPAWARHRDARCTVVL